MCETQDSRSIHLLCYPSSCYVFRGSGKRLRHIGVAVGSIEGAEGRRSTVRRFGERDKVWVCVASKHKAAEGVAMGQDHHGLHQLSQRPALLARLQQRLEGTETRAQGQRTMYNLKVFFSLHLHLCRFCDVVLLCFAVPGCVSRQWAMVGGPAPCWCGREDEDEEVPPPNPATTEGPHPPSETGLSAGTPGSYSDGVLQPRCHKKRKLSTDSAGNIQARDPDYAYTRTACSLTMMAM